MILEDSFDLEVYPLEILKKAGYRYIDKFSINFEIKNNRALCLLTFPDKTTKNQANYYLDQFRKEVLDQDLRNQIKNETEAVRNLILAHAFSKTDLTDE